MATTVRPWVSFPLTHHRTGDDVDHRDFSHAGHRLEDASGMADRNKLAREQAEKSLHKVLKEARS